MRMRSGLFLTGIFAIVQIQMGSAFGDVSVRVKNFNIDPREVDPNGEAFFARPIIDSTVLPAGSGYVAIGGFPGMTEEQICAEISDGNPYALIQRFQQLGEAGGVDMFAGLVDHSISAAVDEDHPLIGKTLYAFIGNGTELASTSMALIVRADEVLHPDLEAVIDLTTIRINQITYGVIDSAGATLPAAGQKFPALQLPFLTPSGRDGCQELTMTGVDISSNPDGETHLTAWTEPNRSGDAGGIVLTRTEDGSLAPTTFTIGIDHQWFLVSENTTLDAAYVIETEQLGYTVDGTPNGTIPLGESLLGFWLGANEDNVPGAGDRFGWVKILNTESAVEILSSAVSAEQEGIIAGQFWAPYQKMPDPNLAITEFERLGTEIHLSWNSRPFVRYVIERTLNFQQYEIVGTIVEPAEGETTTATVSCPEGGACYLRVREL